MKDFIKRLFGYFGTEKRKKQGPSLLGMETNFHKDTPDAQDIRNAVEEVKEAYKHSKESIY